MGRGTLPESILLFLLYLAFPLPQAHALSSPIPLNTPVPLGAVNLTSTNPATFTLPNPSSSSFLSVSIALCSNSTTIPQFWVSNNSDSATPGPSGGTDVYQLSIDENGMANMTLSVQGGNTVTLAVWGASSDDDIEIGASDQGVFPAQYGVYEIADSSKEDLYMKSLQNFPTSATRPQTKPFSIHIRSTRQTSISRPIQTTPSPTPIHHFLPLPRHLPSVTSLSSLRAPQSRNYQRYRRRDVLFVM